MFDPSILFTKNKQHDLPPLGGNSLFDKIWTSIWEEHCVECGVPMCYKQCPIYSKRYDGKCVRLKYGIVKNYNYKGIMNYGLDCVFEKWSKIETRYYPHSTRPIFYSLMNTINNIIYSCLLKLRYNKNIHSIDKLIRFYRKSRNSFLISHYNDLFPDAFHLECYLCGKDSVKLHIQMDDNISNRIFYSNIHNIVEGKNIIDIAFNEINFDRSIKPVDYAARIRFFIAPLSEKFPVNIVFTHLNFIRWRKADFPRHHTEYIKCVAWDLDNTIWSGTLSEDGVYNLALKEDVINTIRELNNKGIINTIVSKNDSQDAIKALKHFGIDDLFICYAINWGSKSENIKMLSNATNISLEYFAFIDDSLRERLEVKYDLPEIRVFSNTHIEFITKDSIFNPPLSRESIKRRDYYRQEWCRKTILDDNKIDYDQYLEHLKIELCISRVRTFKDSGDRCLELLSRSNQLNLRTIRYTKNEFVKLLEEPDYVCFKINANDKYGDYGQIGFVSSQIQKHIMEIKDFVISCRIARRCIEQTIIYSMVQYAKEQGCHILSIKLVKTPKNVTLENILDSLPFSRISSCKEYKHYVLSDFNQLNHSFCKAKIRRID